MFPGIVDIVDTVDTTDIVHTIDTLDNVHTVDKGGYVARLLVKA